MLKLVTFVLVLCSLISFVLCLNIKLPVYVGYGYDLARGNPKESTFDSGFKQQLFELKYNERRNTEDGRFLVPDGMITKDLDYCSNQPTTREYTGVSAYQADLKSIASPSRFSDSLVVTGSFSANPTYKSIQESTKNGDSIFIETSAKCETYSLQLQLKIPELSEAFELDVMLAYIGVHDWERVFEKYGTHYVTSVAYGARAISTYKFKRISYQELKGNSIDTIKIANMLFSKSNTDLKFNDMRLFNQNIEDKKELFIGAQPVSTSDPLKWKSQVILEPKPIEYRLSSIVELITKVKWANLNDEKIEGIRNDVNNAVNKYAERLELKEPKQDPIIPPAVGLVLSKTDSFGGPGGKVIFDERPTDTAIFVRKVLVRSYRYIDSLQFMLSDFNNTKKYGGDGQTKAAIAEEWNVTLGEHINRLEIRYGKYLNSIKFITNLGTESLAYGNRDLQFRDEGIFRRVILPGALAGFFGASDAFVDCVGFYSYEKVYENGSRLVLRDTEEYGGKGGKTFYTPIYGPLVSIRRVSVSSADFGNRYVESFQFTLSDGSTTNRYGGRKDLKPIEWSVPDNEFIYRIEIKIGSYLRSIKFITNKGTESPKFGSQDTKIQNEEKVETIQLSGPLVGVFGKQGDLIDSIGFYSYEKVNN